MATSLVIEQETKTYHSSNDSLDTNSERYPSTKDNDISSVAW